MLKRIIGALVLITMGMISGCDVVDPCLEVGDDEGFGTDHLEKVDLLSAHAGKLGLPTTLEEVATVVGAAYASSQIEGGQDGVPVSICLRRGRQGDTEFRVLTMRGKLLSDWQSADFVLGRR